MESVAEENFPVIKILLTADSVWTRRQLHAAQLERCTATLLRETGVHQGMFAGVKLCHREEMAQLHGQYMNDPTPTDVLSFESCDEDQSYLGDVIACVDVAAEHAARLGHSVVAECQFYVLHGLLHLLGLDDHQPRQRRHMLKLQKEALLQQGIVFKS